MNEKGQRYGDPRLLTIFDGESHDCGSKIGWLKANLAFAKDRPEFTEELAAYTKELF